MHEGRGHAPEKLPVGRAGESEDAAHAANLSQRRRDRPPRRPVRRAPRSRGRRGRRAQREVRCRFLGCAMQKSSRAHEGEGADHRERPERQLARRAAEVRVALQRDRRRGVARAHARLPGDLRERRARGTPLRALSPPCSSLAVVVASRDGPQPASLYLSRRRLSCRPLDCPPGPPPVDSRARRIRAPRGPSRDAKEDGMYIGAHVNSSGGVWKAIGNGVDIGCEAIQFFAGSPRTWKPQLYKEQDWQKFREAARGLPHPLRRHPHDLPDQSGERARRLLREVGGVAARRRGRRGAARRRRHRHAHRLASGRRLRGGTRARAGGAAAGAGRERGLGRPHPAREHGRRRRHHGPGLRRARRHHRRGRQPPPPRASAWTRRTSSRPASTSAPPQGLDDARRRVSTPPAASTASRCSTSTTPRRRSGPIATGTRTSARVRSAWTASAAS